MLITNKLISIKIKSKLNYKLLFFYFLNFKLLYRIKKILIIIQK